MKETFRKILSISMAFVVLFSTMSFSLDMHYCGDHLVDFSLSEKVDTCMMKAQMTKSSTECAAMDMEMDCCSDVEIVIEGQDELKISFDKLTFDQQLFVASFVYSYNNLFEGLEEKVSSHNDYPPPLVTRQIYKLDETYLI